MITSEDLINKLKSIKLQDAQMLQEIEVLCKDVDDPKIIEPLFRVFENNPNFDFGSPGNLVRIIEKFYQSQIYEDELYKSVERKPTEYNLWMLNRLLNTFDEDRKITGIELLENVMKNPNLPESLKDTAGEFLEEQTE
jgi:hypothetical protein